jgi:hypothetical protein
MIMRIACKPHLTAAVLCTLLGTLMNGPADAQVSAHEGRALRWSESAAAAGARQAPLWGEAGADQGVALKWRFNTRLRDQVAKLDHHYLVVAGTFTVESAGQYREYGPGSYVGIAAGTKHTIGCEASGDCQLVLFTLKPAAPK